MRRRRGLLLVNQPAIEVTGYFSSGCGRLFPRITAPSICQSGVQNEFDCFFAQHLLPSVALAAGLCFLDQFAYELHVSASV